MKYLSLFALCLLMAFQITTQGNWRDKISKKVIANIETKGESEFFVVFVQQANLTPAKKLRGKDAKSEYVFEQLRKTARQTQARAIQTIREFQREAHPYYLLNAIYTKGNLDLVEALSKLPEVRAIYDNPSVKLSQPEPDRTSFSQRDNVTWGIGKINADDLWDLGIRGEGIVVAGADTGVKWDVAPIKEQYRGYHQFDTMSTNHDYNWHDAIHSISPLHNDSIVLPSNNPCGLNSLVPCDDNNHGTHTVGTMTGSGTEEVKIGVAPESKWIACRNMERGWGSPASYIECFEWFLAPTDLNNENPDPSKSPHVINNSWSCPEIEGCNSDNWWMIETAVNNLKAAGIVVVVSAGNLGPNCNTISTPAAIFEGSFTVGAMSERDSIANFSGRGTVLADSSMRMKPNVVAPGVQVLSCIRDGSFKAWNGTSMAGPHVAGAVALLLSAYPQLIGEVDLIEDILEETAVPMEADTICDGYAANVYPNPIVGYGRIDVLAAYERAGEIVLQLDNSRSKQIKVYPNPTSNELTFEGFPLQKDIKWQLFNTNGRLVMEGELQASPKQNIKLQYLPNGIYIYRIKGRNFVETGKVLKVSMIE